MNKNIIHIGLPRTGSKFLRKKIFVNIDKSQIYFKEHTGLYDKYSNLGWKAYVKSLTHPVLISGGDYSKVDNYPIPMTRVTNREQSIKNFKHSFLFHDAKIILILRERESHMRSMHVHLCTDKRLYEDFIEFDEWICQYEQSDIDEYYDYDKYVDLLKENFEEVYVDWYGNMVKDLDFFVQKICDFIGVDVPEYDGRSINSSEQLLSRLGDVKYEK